MHWEGEFRQSLAGIAPRSDIVLVSLRHGMLSTATSSTTNIILELLQIQQEIASQTGRRERKKPTQLKIFEEG